MQCSMKVRKRVQMSSRTITQRYLQTIIQPLTINRSYCAVHLYAGYGRLTK